MPLRKVKLNRAKVKQNLYKLSTRQDVYQSKLFFNFSDTGGTKVLEITHKAISENHNPNMRARSNKNCDRNSYMKYKK